METEDKVTENYYRRMAKRLGLELKKSRNRKTNVDDWGGYMILNPDTDICYWGPKFNLAIADVAKILEAVEKHYGKSRILTVDDIVNISKNL